MDDREIVELYFARDERAIAETDRAHGAPCRAVARGIVGTREDAEECVNDTYLRVWNAVPPERPVRLRAYLLKICRRLALGRYAQKTAQKRGGGEVEAVLDELGDVVGAESAERVFEYAELVRAIDGFVLGLPPNEAALFIRRYFYCESVGSAAASLGVTEGSAAVSLHRIRGKLRVRLSEMGFEV